MRRSTARGYVEREREGVVKGNKRLHRRAAKECVLPPAWEDGNLGIDIAYMNYGACACLRAQSRGMVGQTGFA